MSPNQPTKVCLGLVSLLALAASTPREASAQDRPTLSGTWSASALTEAWNIGDWGESCGPRPSPRGAGGGTISVSESGGELVFGGGGYPRTSGCFEMGGGISVTSHSASPRGWRTTCATSPGDPRRATIITTVTATDKVISFDETGQYQFILKEQNCTASVRRSRSYSLVRRLGEEAPPAASSAPPAASAPPTATAELPKPEEKAQPASCSTPGEPARIEVKPARKLLKPGESFAPKAALFDEAGCRLSSGVSWSTLAPASKVSVTATGQVTAAPDAPEGEYVVLAGVNGKAARLTVEVISPERFAQLLASGSTIDTNEVAVAVLASGTVGSSVAVAQDSAKQRKLLFLGIVGGAVVLLGGLGFALLRRARPEMVAVEEEVVGEPQAKVVRKKRVVVKVSAESALFCPTCKRGFSPGPAFCPHDGGRLEPNPDWKGAKGS